MGMFSWNCKACGYSLRECRGCTEDGWQADVVILLENGSRIFGEYDGYGRVGSFDAAHAYETPCVYHRACWELVGRPEYDGPSDDAHDQGFCLPEGVGHGDPPLPKPTMVWLNALPIPRGIVGFFEGVNRVLWRKWMRERHKEAS